MSEPRIVLCTLLLNEVEWCAKLYEQHRNWPGMVRWVFVEAADSVYAKVNPDRVTPSGMSVDGTSEFLSRLAETDERVRYIPHGFSFSLDPAQGKCAARDRYLRASDDDRPDFLVVVDADEFYPRETQERINETMARDRDAWGWCFRHREIWYPPFYQNDFDKLPGFGGTFQYEAVGGFWDIPYARCWRWFEGLKYSDNHNTPSSSRIGPLDKKLVRYDKDESEPYFVHMAFASRLADRAAKHRYYEERGEAKDRKRRWYTESRAAYETWQPGDELPHGAKVVPYTGQIPEVFR